MSILARYILRAVLGYTALAMLVLLALGALFLFISEQGDIGTGNYTASQAMMFVLLSLPTFAGQLLPIAALIGALLALGNLARGSELVVMRASGITTARFCWWLAVAGIILAVLMVSMSEFVAPPMEKYARQLKVFSKFSEFSFAGNRGTWVRDGDTVVSVEQQSSASRFGGVQLFRFDAKRRLVTVARAESASVNRENTWRLENYSETRFSPDGTTVRTVPVEEIRTSITPDFLGLAVIEPQVMGLRDLVAYTDHLRRNDLDSTRFEVAFWSRDRAHRGAAAGADPRAAVRARADAQHGAGRAHGHRHLDRRRLRAGEPDAREQRAVAEPLAAGHRLAADRAARGAYARDAESRPLTRFGNRTTRVRDRRSCQARPSRSNRIQK